MTFDSEYCLIASAKFTNRLKSIAHFSRGKETPSPVTSAEPMSLSSFRLTAESNCAMTIVKLVFQPMTTKTNSALYVPCDSFRALTKIRVLSVISRNSDWFIALFIRVVIGGSRSL